MAEVKAFLKRSGEPFFLPNFCTLHSFLFLLIGGELIALILILATGDILLESWDELALLSIFVQWITFSTAAILCLLRRWLSTLSLRRAALCAYGLMLVTSLVISAAAQAFLLKINYQWGAVPETLAQFVFRSVAITAILGGVALRYFYVHQQWKERIELESQARVEVLQARIRPHFLFNSMNIIASLIHSHPNLAEQAVEDLSELFRANLRQGNSFVLLSEEWQLCEHYLRIESLRLEERLTVKTDFSQIPKDAMIPMLSLQPLVENAIYHGIQPLKEGGTIQVWGTMQENKITISLTNPVVEKHHNKLQQGNKMAIANIKHRLNLLFGSHAELVTNQTKRGVFEVKLVLPYLKEIDL